MLRGRDDLPRNTDSLYVVDIRYLFKGYCRCGRCCSTSRALR
jgi:hypothetical protein